MYIPFTWNKWKWWYVRKLFSRKPLSFCIGTPWKIFLPFDDWIFLGGWGKTYCKTLLKSFRRNSKKEGKIKQDIPFLFIFLDWKWTAINIFFEHMPSKNSSLGVQRNCCERSESFGENWRIIMESDYIEISKLSMNERYSTVFVSQWICLHFLRCHDSRNCWRGVFVNGIDWHLVWIYLS